MKNFLEILLYDPIPPLLASGDEALIYFTRRDLLGEEVPARWSDYGSCREH